MSETEYFSSDFEPFGLLEFSGQEPLAKRIYDSLRESLGEAFHGPSQDAETYADAMCLAVAQLQMDLAAAQDDPNQVNYLLPDIERDYKVLVPYGATIEDRRIELLAAQAAASGSLESAIQTGLSAIFGSSLVGWRFMRLDPTDVDSEVKLVTDSPIFVPPNTPVKVIEFTETIMPGEQTVPYTWITDRRDIAPNDRFTLDCVAYASHEAVEVSGVGVNDDDIDTITATFTKPHNPGTLATTALQPFWSSTKCHCIVGVADVALTNPTLISRAHKFLRKALPATSTWAFVHTNGNPLGEETGPFTVGYGLIGNTPISTDVIPIS